jgi:hypothetical protein
VTNKDFAGPMRIFYAWMMQLGAPLFKIGTIRQPGNAA